MKKINLFNRNIDLPSYRRMPVSRGFNRGGGIPLFSGMTKKICHKFPSREGWRVAPAGVWFAALVALFVATPSFATDPDPVAQKTVASKAYVDTKQDQIATGLVTYHEPEENTDYTVPALVSYGTGTNNADGVLGNKIGILGINVNGGSLGSWEFLDLWEDSEAAYLDNFVPTVRAVANALENMWDNMPDWWSALTWDSAETASTNAYDVTFVGDTGATANAWPSADKTKLINTAALAQGLALKQNKITTGLVTFHEPEENIDYTVPALVSYGTGTTNADGVLGNKIGILGINDAFGGLNSGESLDLWDDSEAAYLDNFVPTVRAVAAVVEALQSITWTAAIHKNAVNAYSTSFTGTTNNWPSADSTRLVNGSTFAQGLALKQNKLDAKASNARAQAVTRSTAGNTASAYITAGGSVGLTTRSGAPAIIGYVNGTAVTDSTAMTTFTTGTFGSNSTANQNYIKNALVSLELLKDVYSELNTKITNNALPTGTTGTVVTYNGTNATTGVQEFGETAMTGTVTYTNGVLNNANNIATITAVGTRQKKKECGGYEPAAAGQPAHDGTHPGDEDYCWLWIFPED